MPSEVVDEFLEDVDTKENTPQATVTLSQDRVNVQLAVGLGTSIGLALLVAVIASVCVSVVCMCGWKHPKR